MTSAAKPRPIIMGIILGMDIPKIGVFFESLRGTGYDGPIVVFATKISREMAAYLKSHNVTIIYKNFHNVTIRTLFAKRYYFYREYLKAHRDEYDIVLTSDIRDVAFQSNPFDQVTSTKVHYFEESDQFLIRDSRPNWLWAKKIWPPEISEILYRSTEVCAGVQLAATAEMLAYYDIYIRAFEKLPFRLKRKLGGGDQSVHQYVAHVLKADGIFVPNNGLVATMGTERVELYTQDSAGRITMPDGHAPPILHQYDRHADITAKLEAVYLPQAEAARQAA